MPQEEKYGTRDRTYSAWHRRMSTQRFVGIERAQLLAMIDLDASLYVEYDDGTWEPLLLVETAIDKGQGYKCAAVTQKLAAKAGIAAYVLLYKIADTPNPAAPEWHDISQFRVKRLWPAPDKAWRQVMPLEWARALVKVRAWAANKIDLLIAGRDMLTVAKDG